LEKIIRARSVNFILRLARVVPVDAGIGSAAGTLAEATGSGAGVEADAAGRGSLMTVTGSIGEGSVFEGAKTGFASGEGAATAGGDTDLVGLRIGPVSGDRNLMGGLRRTVSAFAIAGAVSDLGSGGRGLTVAAFSVGVARTAGLKAGFSAFGSGPFSASVSAFAVSAGVTGTVGLIATVGIAGEFSRGPRSARPLNGDVGSSRRFPARKKMLGQGMAIKS
jgi:hypothetical protein